MRIFIAFFSDYARMLFCVKDKKKQTNSEFSFLSIDDLKRIYNTIINNVQREKTI